MQKILGTGLRLSIFLFFAYCIITDLWHGLFEIIPHARVAGINEVVHTVAFTPAQVQHYNQLIDVASYAESILLATFSITFFVWLAVALGYWVNHRKPENPIVRFVDKYRRNIRYSIAVTITLFYVAALVTPMLYKAYPLKIQNNQLLNDLQSVRNGISSDKLQDQINQCWDVPENLGEAQKVPVEIAIGMNPDHTIHDARVVDQDRFSHDSNFRTLAESALAALKKPQCSHLDLPNDHYELWKDIDFTFVAK